MDSRARRIGGRRRQERISIGRREELLRRGEEVVVASGEIDADGVGIWGHRRR